jgi:hypothetical protein
MTKLKQNIFLILGRRFLAQDHSNTPMLGRVLLGRGKEY